MSENLQEELLELLRNCQDKSKLHESTDKLDKLASKCFDSFLRGIVEILCEKDGIHHVSDQIIAAKEFCRQLTSPSKSFARLQLKKWNNLDSQTKDYVKDKLMSVLANLESSELVEAIQSTITIIAASWSDCIEKIASVSIDEKSSMHALTASFNILGNIVTPGFEKKMPDDVILRAFKNGLTERCHTVYTQGFFHEMQSAVLIFVTKVLRQWTVSSNLHWPSESTKFLNQLCKTIIEQNVLVLSNDYGCDAAVTLMVEILLKQQRMPQHIKVEAKNNWLEMLKGGLHSKLNFICCDTMGMEASSKTVKLFFKTFDQL